MLLSETSLNRAVGLLQKLPREGKLDNQSERSAKQHELGGRCDGLFTHQSTFHCHIRSSDLLLLILHGAAVNTFVTIVTFMRNSRDLPYFATLIYASQVFHFTI